MGDWRWKIITERSVELYFGARSGKVKKVGWQWHFFNQLDAIGSRICLEQMIICTRKSFFIFLISRKTVFWQKSERFLQTKNVFSTFMIGSFCCHPKYLSILRLLLTVFEAAINQIMSQMETYSENYGRNEVIHFVLFGWIINAVK